jgi:hypothetical protein
MNPRIYRFLLGLYPQDHRELFGTEMEAVLQQAAEERRALGFAAYLRFTIWEVVGFIAGAAAVWAARFAGQPRIEQAVEMPASPAGEIREAERLIQLQIDRMVYAIANHQFAQARLYSDEERKARARLQQLRDDQSLRE